MDTIKINGKLNIDKVSNNKVENFKVPNTVVTLGKEQIAIRIVSGTYALPDPYRWMSIGTGSDTIVASDTTLGTEVQRIPSDLGSTTTTSTTNDTSRWIGSFGIIATNTINEAGLFNASGVDLGSMLSRTTFADISVISGDWINVTWDLAFS